MTTPTIEEMVETFERAALLSYGAKGRVRVGLRAVIEKHIGPMLAEAHCVGQRDMADGCFYANHAHDYAARILSDLTAPVPQETKGT